ncbi:MAG: chromate transporter, partial [Alphaproteobacteria bacterium]
MTKIQRNSKTPKDHGSAPQRPLSLAACSRVWAKIGILSFGGPAAQIALMHREIVTQRRWLSEQQF